MNMFGFPDLESLKQPALLAGMCNHYKHACPDGYLHKVVLSSSATVLVDKPASSAIPSKAKIFRPILFN